MGRFLRIIAILLMGLTATHTLLGAVGSVCISWWPEKYVSLAVIAPYKGVYQVATIFTFIAAFIGFRAFVGLIKGKAWAYTSAIIALLLGITTAGVKMFFSNMLRGSTMPTDARLYLTSLTLIFFLLIRIPGIWEMVGLSRPRQDGSTNTGAGVALILAGILALTTPVWAGPSHMMNGYNLVLVLEKPLLIGGTALILVGSGFLIRSTLRESLPSPSPADETRLPA